MKTIAKVVSIDGRFAVAEKAGSGWLIGAARFEEEYSAQALARSINAELYEVCPACSSTRITRLSEVRRASDEVSSCSSCRAIFGRVESWADYVEISPVFCTGGSRRYFDFSRPFGGERFHGWVNESGRVTQIG